MSKGNADLPCLITPDVLHFSAKNERGTPQVITIFNHHEFAIHYKILSTSPQLYTIGSTQGMINPVSSMEIVIELKEEAARLIQQGSTVQDKFRIEVADANGTASHKKIIKTTASLARSYMPSSQPQLSDFVDLDTLRKAYISAYRMMPLIVGVLILLLLTPSDNFLVAVKLWFAFFVGFACMYFKNKLQQT